MNTKMLKYITKRLALSLFAIFLIVTITFFIMHAVPSSPFAKPKALPQSVIDALNKKFGLDKPLLEQYLVYLGNVVKFDFGESIKFQGRNAMDLILNGFKTSIQLGLMAAALALVLGVVLGSVSALKRDSKFDKIVLIFSTASISLPSFVTGVFLLWIFGVWWQILPTRGDTAGGFVLPVISLMLYPMAYIIRLMRSSMLDVLSQDYIRTANAKGVSKPLVIFKHAMKNALTPIVTYTGPMLAYIITGSIVVEKIFSMAGLGKYFVNSIIDSDYTMIMGTTVFLAILMIGLNFICDIVYKILDKRIDFS